MYSVFLLPFMLCYIIRLVSVVLNIYSVSKKGVTYLCIKVEELKAFSENTTPHQQHWAGSVQVSPSNHFSAIGQRHPYAADVKMLFL